MGFEELQERRCPALCLCHVEVSRQEVGSEVCLESFPACLERCFSLAYRGLTGALVSSIWCIEPILTTRRPRSLRCLFRPSHIGLQEVLHLTLYFLAKYLLPVGG